jgi:DNA-binding Xre family transcriptional regulator
LKNCKENADMDVCYNKLFKLLIDKSMKKTEFRKAVGISQNTLAKLSNNENVSMDVLVKICRTLNCTVDEILDIVPDVNSVDENDFKR